MPTPIPTMVVPIVPALSIRLFGGFAVSVRGQPLRKLRTRQGNRLLALLALAQGRVLERSALIGQLWLDSATDEAALGSMRRALTDLRDALGPEMHRLESVSKFTLRLDLADGGFCDVPAFDHAIANGTPESLDVAIDLYAGPLMPDLDAVYDPDGTLRNERDRRHFVFLDTLQRRADRRRASGRIAPALADFRRLLAADPMRESAARSLMELLADAGDRAGAIAEYQRLRRTLSQDLDAKPDRETRALYERLQAGITIAPGARTGVVARTANHPITFLFTDIEGSTALWESDPKAMAPVLARHDALLRQAIDLSEGIVFKAVGDGFYAAFDAPADALAAAIEAQRLIAQEPWPDGLLICVRMAIHIGIAEQRGGDYFGVALNRLAHLLTIGWGGQTLLSSAACEMVRDALPDGVSLHSLGEHRLKDLTRPETLYQLTHPDLPATFPPLRSLNIGQHNLPTRLTRFIGREAVVVAVRTLLRDNRLLTLTGTGGAGKTRLAQQVAADALDEYPDGVWQTELAALPTGADTALVARTIAGTLGVKEQPGQTSPQTLIGYLHDRRLLLLLDNCEHLIDACARLADDILTTCPHVTILATSREPLAIFGEQTYRVPSLTLPSQEQAGATTAESLGPYEAVRLFVDRAALAKPDFALSDANAATVARLCRQLDGIPLALELAAARTRTLPLEQMANRLGDRFRLLTGGERAALPRQQTLRALVDWSYDLLTADEKTLFARLSVFAGGWTLEAAESVCGANPLDDRAVLDLLTSLADKSLALAEEQTDGTVRYRMLETLREYAAEKLSENGETKPTRSRHREWCLLFAAEAEQKFQGPEQNLWVNRLESEHDNLRAALTGGERPTPDGFSAGLSESTPDEWQAAWEAALSRSRLAGLLHRFWLAHGYLTEGREHLQRALADQRALRAVFVRGDAGGALDALLEKDAAASVLRGAGALANRQNDLAAARAHYEESLLLYREVGDKSGIADVLRGLGVVDCSEGDYHSAWALHTESLGLKREVGDVRGLVNTLNCLGLVHYRQGDYPAARSLYRESLSLSREIGDTTGIANMLNSLGIIDYSQGDYASAQWLYEECLGLYREMGDRSGVASTLNCLGLIEHSRGDYASARALYEESLSVYREIGDKRGIANGLHCLGDIVLHQGDSETAQRQYEESLSLYSAIGDKRGVGITLNCLGNIALQRGDRMTARAFYEEGLGLKRVIGDKRGVANTLNCLGSLALDRNEIALAHALYEEGLGLSREIGDKRSVNDALQGMMHIAFREGAFDRTMTLSSFIDVLSESLGVSLSREAQTDCDRYRTEARAVLGESTVAAARDRGRAMTWEQAVAYALGEETSEP